ncbi:hypothetical protein FRC10_009875 [Ceratobasidium sp. 414]|nr:hypothetical protein FRC10_009875 [Ceratobasidium sp. 414]
MIICISQMAEYRSDGSVESSKPQPKVLPAPKFTRLWHLIHWLHITVAMPLLQLPNGVSLSYSSYPDPAPSPSRPTVLFLAALVQRAEIQMEVQIRDERLKGFNFVGIDVHGHGDTTGRDQWNHADNARDVVAGMKALGVDKFFVYGTSNGGVIAQEVAIRYPDNVRGLILCATTSRNLGPELSTRFRQFLIPNWMASIPPPDATLMASCLTTFGVPAKPADQPGSAFGDRKPVSDDGGERTVESAVGLELVCRIVDNWRAHTGENKVVKPVEAMLNWEGCEDRLGGVKVPVLVVHGVDDPTFALERGEQTFSLLPKNEHTRLVKLDGKGAHLINVIADVATEVNGATREWLDECIRAGF